jgi:hypothetical protein
MRITVYPDLLLLLVPSTPKFSRELQYEHATSSLLLVQAARGNIAGLLEARYIHLSRFNRERLTNCCFELAILSSSKITDWLRW